MDPHEPKVPLLGTPEKQESARQSALRNLLDLEEPSEAPYYQGVLTYTKNLSTYVLDLMGTFLVFAHDAEVPALVLGEYIDRICIRTEADHGRLGQDKDMEQ